MKHVREQRGRLPHGFYGDARDYMIWPQPAGELPPPTFEIKDGRLRIAEAPSKKLGR